MRIAARGISHTADVNISPVVRSDSSCHCARGGAQKKCVVLHPRVRSSLRDALPDAPDVLIAGGRGSAGDSQVLANGVNRRIGRIEAHSPSGTEVGVHKGGDCGDAGVVQVQNRAGVRPAADEDPRVGRVGRKRIDQQGTSYPSGGRQRVGQQCFPSLSVSGDAGGGANKRSRQGGVEGAALFHRTILF
jgi:hypothetical protein